ncbi:unnamed protein product, partial [Porites evermanni]
LVQSNHLSRTPAYYRHLIITDSLLCFKPPLTDTRLLQTPHYYGQFALPNTSLSNLCCSLASIFLVQSNHLSRTPAYYRHLIITD